MKYLKKKLQLWKTLKSIKRCAKTSRRLEMERSLTKYIKKHKEVNILNYFFYRIVWKIKYKV